jgi:hypothetical protein
LEATLKLAVDTEMKNIIEPFVLGPVNGTRPNYGPFTYKEAAAAGCRCHLPEIQKFINSIPADKCVSVGHHHRRLLLDSDSDGVATVNGTSRQPHPFGLNGVSVSHHRHLMIARNLSGTETLTQVNSALDKLEAFNGAASKLMAGIVSIESRLDLDGVTFMEEVIEVWNSIEDALEDIMGPLNILSPIFEKIDDVLGSLT